jgi:hypothetical protein
MKMAKILMVYSIGEDAKRITFNRKLFSYKIQSHAGKYKYRSKGILTQYEKPLRSVIIFDKEKLSETKQLCKKFDTGVKF